MRERNRISIRSVRASDIATLVHWGAQSPELWGSKVSKWYTARGLKRYLLVLQNDIFLVAEIGEKLVGMCHARYMHEWLYWENLFVDKGFRRRGVAEKLFKEMVKACKKKKGLREIGLQVRHDNTEAKRFYKKMGFRMGFLYFWMEKDLIRRKKV
ncbi:GNAT family N-acetyltransferase [Candidatus Gottesmanbacteria bacterium]|nr:GNAT family N-acetyltransferase [Candidatus Gottesmanbacteria bacterium]